jgi:hypothetical protein
MQLSLGVRRTSCEQTAQTALSREHSGHLGKCFLALWQSLTFHGPPAHRQQQRRGGWEFAFHAGPMKFNEATICLAKVVLFLSLLSTLLVVLLGPED